MVPTQLLNVIQTNKLARNANGSQRIVSEYHTPDGQFLAVSDPAFTSETMGAELTRLSARIQELEAMVPAAPAPELSASDGVAKKLTELTKLQSEVDGVQGKSKILRSQLLRQTQEIVGELTLLAESLSPPIIDGKLSD